MKEKNNTDHTFGQMLESYARLATEQNTQTNKKIDSLVATSQETSKTLQTLAETVIRSEERHRQYDERFARIEDNQKTAGAERKHLTEHMILTSKDIERNADRWAGMYKVLSGVLTAIIGAAIITAYKIK